MCPINKAHFSHEFKYDKRQGMSNLDIDLRVHQLLQGNRVALSRTITLVESTRPDHKKEAD